jgi:WhiB family transcriptional regulator, redox-sensing transcriptional regulator
VSAAAPAAPLAVNRRPAILAYLADHPDLTALELARVIGGGSYIARLLEDMQIKAQVISGTERRPGQGRPVRIWRLAPPGTIPPPRLADALARRRERERITTAARRARARRPRDASPFAGAPLLPDAACADADPALFFPEPGDAETEAKAVAICAGCPVRAACYTRAVQNGERWGIWGGVNLETRRQPQPGELTQEGLTSERAI